MFSFDPRSVQPFQGFQPVPENWYKVIIRKSNMKTTAKGDGGYLELQCEIVEGQYTGRILYWNLNIFNPSQQAVATAYSQLSAIAYCVGFLQQINAQQAPDNIVPMLHNIPFLVMVVVGQGNQGPINNIRACKDVQGNEPGKAGAPGQPMAPQPQPGGAPQGWQAPPATVTAPGGYTPPANPAAPAQQWQNPAAPPNTQQWQAPQNPAAPGPGPQPYQAPQQPAQQWQAPTNPAPGQPAQTWQAPAGQPTNPAPGPQPAQPWQQQAGAPAAAPWVR